MPEKDFLSLMNLIAGEVENAFVFFHSAEELNRLAIEDKRMLTVLNADAMFWNAYRASVQTTMFITLSRLFDTTGGAINFQSLLTATKNNPQIFSRESLGARKLIGGQKPPWWEEYMSAAWYPQGSADLKPLQKAFNPLASEFEKIYLPIRHNIYAHRFISDNQAMLDLFPKTDRSRLGMIINTLDQIMLAILNLYMNGTKPDLEPEQDEGRADRARRSISDILNKLRKTSGRRSGSRLISTKDMERYGRGT